MMERGVKLNDDAAGMGAEWKIEKNSPSGGSLKSFRASEKFEALLSRDKSGKGEQRDGSSQSLSDAGKSPQKPVKSILASSRITRGETPPSTVSRSPLKKKKEAAEHTLTKEQKTIRFDLREQHQRSPQKEASKESNGNRLRSSARKSDSSAEGTSPEPSTKKQQSRAVSFDVQGEQRHPIKEIRSPSSPRRSSKVACEKELKPDQAPDDPRQDSTSSTIVTPIITCTSPSGDENESKSITEGKPRQGSRGSIEPDGGIVCTKAELGSFLTKDKKKPRMGWKTISMAISGFRVLPKSQQLQPAEAAEDPEKGQEAAAESAEDPDQGDDEVSDVVWDENVGMVLDVSKFGSALECFLKRKTSDPSDRVPPESSPTGHRDPRGSTKPDAVE